MSSRVVKTKEELKKAKIDQVDKIIVEGKLAEQLKSAKKITTMSSVALAALSTLIAGGIATAPFTGGVSMALTAATAAPIALTTGLSVPAIILVSFLGVGFIIALFKEYEMEINLPAKTLTLTRKKSLAD